MKRMHSLNMRRWLVIICMVSTIFMLFNLAAVKQIDPFPSLAVKLSSTSINNKLDANNKDVNKEGGVKDEKNEELELMLRLADHFNGRSGIFRFNDKSYDEVMDIQNSDYYHYKNRKQYPQVSFADVSSSKDITILFEDKEQFRLFWREPMYTGAIVQYEMKEIPCDHYGVKRCSVTYDRNYSDIADGIAQIAAFKRHQEPLIPVYPNQSYIGYYTEADDIAIGCQKKVFDAKLSYSPDATIRYNDNCNIVRIMYKCMSRAIRIVSKKKGLSQREINKWKRNLYQYCVKLINMDNPDVSEQDIEANAMTYRHGEVGDVAMFVSNCAIPRSYYIKSLVEVANKTEEIKVHSYGKCYNNRVTEEQKWDLGKKYKFLFAMENKLKMDYVTEKIFQAYQTGAVPIYRGSPNIFDYAPSGSFIGLYIFAKPQQLVDYIFYLLKNETAYDEYFNWDFDGWVKKPHTIQCLQIEAEAALDAGWCSVCDWLANIAPLWKKKGLNNCDKSEYAPYFGYPRNPLKYKSKYN